MIVVVALIVLWASYALANRLRAKVEGIEPGHRHRGSGTETAHTPVARDVPCGLASWSALDDHQLTRLLIQSASTTTADAPDDGTEH
jgi:hypothetical protein